MKNKIRLGIGCVLVLLTIVVGYKGLTRLRGRGVNMEVKSMVADHPEADIEVLIKNKDEDTYDVLAKDSIISGEVDIVINPPAEKAYDYVEYKFNGLTYIPAYPSAYGITIDTKELPNGWNQLMAIGYTDKLEGVKQIIFKVENSKDEAVRAPRLQGYEVGSVPSYKREYIPVLMYHDFQENISQEQESGVVHPELFEEQLQALLDNGYTAINFYDLYLYMNGEGGLPEKPVMITADDGYLSNYETAFPILKKYNIPATFFISTKYVGVNTSSPHFTWEQAKEMEESGLVDIQSHSHNHIPLITLPSDEIHYEASISFGLIEQYLGKRDVKVVAYPQFYNSKMTQEILMEEGVDLQITRLGKGRKARTEPINIQRIHVANYTTPEKLIKEIKKLTK